MSFGLSGKRVVVTGGDSGIGLAVAQGFKAAGCAVTILSERESVFATAAALGMAGRRCDVRDSAGLVNALADVGSIDVAIGNAGIGLPTPLDGGAAAAEAFATVIGINLIGAFHFAQAALPHIPDGGRLIFTSSNMAKLAHAGFAAYVASKHGLTGMLRSLALEIGPREITVNAVCPNIVRSEAMTQAAKAAGVTPEELSAPLIAGQALPGRLMDAEQLIDTYLFLASIHAAQITGQTISVDRGATMS